jgi:hypothetical protein
VAGIRLAPGDIATPHNHLKPVAIPERNPWAGAWKRKTKVFAAPHKYIKQVAAPIIVSHLTTQSSQDTMNLLSGPVIIPLCTANELTLSVDNGMVSRTHSHIF